jgi:hypothetical protein
MGKRSWLNDAIANEYLPFLSSLNDDEAGRAEAEEFNQTIRDSWAQRGLSTVAQQQSGAMRKSWGKRERLEKSKNIKKYV